MSKSKYMKNQNDYMFWLISKKNNGNKTNFPKVKTFGKLSNINILDSVSKSHPNGQYRLEV